MEYISHISKDVIKKFADRITQDKGRSYRIQTELIMLLVFIIPTTPEGIILVTNQLNLPTYRIKLTIKKQI